MKDFSTTYKSLMTLMTFALLVYVGCGIHIYFGLQDLLIYVALLLSCACLYLFYALTTMKKNVGNFETRLSNMREYFIQRHTSCENAIKSLQHIEHKRRRRNKR